MAPRVRKGLYVKMIFALIPKKDEKEQTTSKSGEREFHEKGTKKPRETHRDEHTLSCWRKR